MDSERGRGGESAFFITITIFHVKNTGRGWREEEGGGRVWESTISSPHGGHVCL